MERGSRGQRGRSPHLQVAQVGDVRPTAHVRVYAFDVNNSHRPHVVVWQTTASHLAKGRQRQTRAPPCHSYFGPTDITSSLPTTHRFNFRVICSQLPHHHRHPRPDLLIHTPLQGLYLLRCHGGGVQLNDTSLTAQLPAPTKNACCCSYDQLEGRSVRHQVPPHHWECGD